MDLITSCSGKMHLKKTQNVPQDRLPLHHHLQPPLRTLLLPLYAEVLQPLLPLLGVVLTAGWASALPQSWDSFFFTAISWRYKDGPTNTKSKSSFALHSDASPPGH